MSEYIAKASIEPRDYRVVFLIQKEAHLNDTPLVLLSFTPAQRYFTSPTISGTAAYPFRSI